MNLFALEDQGQSCDECGRTPAVMTIATRDAFVRLCQNDLDHLRSLLRRRRRPLNPRILTALRAITAAPELQLTESELRVAVGKYATNTLKSLCARGFAARSGAGPYEITPQGIEALQSATP